MVDDVDRNPERGRGRRTVLIPASSVSELRGVGPVRAAALELAGYDTVCRLLYLLPRQYEDRRTMSTVDGLTSEGPCTLQGRLHGLAPIRLRRRSLTMVRGRLVTSMGELPIVWFNRPYVASQVDPDTEYLLHGRLQRRGGSWQLINPTVERLDNARLSGTIVPVYRALGSISPSLVRSLIGTILDDLALEELRDPLPLELRRRYGFPELGEALRQIHRPSADVDVEALNDFSTSAQQRLAYEELLEFQLELGLIRREIIEQPKRHAYGRVLATREAVESTLPFELTRAQAAAVGEILDDLESPCPMMRLLQGDVGSGKTAVAAIAMAVAAESGLQAALMAPTELLAEQHLGALRRLLGERYPILLLTASASDSGRSRALLESGEARLVVGTHSLIQDRVRFDSLGLVIIDEQHRFGVGQRRRLQRKGRRPDLLVMTATPIPRSLTLTVYGDLALSVIDELPPGRHPVETRVVPQAEREEVYGWLERRLAVGERAYVVLPLIDESEVVAAESIKGLGSELAARFARFRPAVVHGRNSAEDRARAMAGFAAGESGLLIATTLVEVGVDVPEASVMIIESAERFGLSQLHQLRGRVGRGEIQSSCIAIHGSVSEEGRRRLAVFGRTSDGFEIAEADLEIRGPGELLGTRQAGMAEFRIADLVRDRKWIEAARSDARDLIARSPSLARCMAEAAGDVSAWGPLAGA
jgi:ATP-dependent DNA helicase RecG